MVRLLGAVVNQPVHLDGQPRIEAIEIQHIIARAVLTAELEAVGTLAEMLPEQDLRQRQLFTQFAGEMGRTGICLGCEVLEHPSPLTPPPPPSAAVPLPETSSGRIWQGPKGPDWRIVTRPDWPR